MVKLKKSPTFFLKRERERSFKIALSGEKASLRAMVTCSEQLANCFLI